MRKPLVLIPLLLALGVVMVAGAETSAVLSVDANDLAEAGYTSVMETSQDGSRFAAPLRYFRVAESAEADAKDCADCVNLVVIHQTISATVPDWHERGDDPLHLIGKRVQARRYHAPTKSVIIVTGPGLEHVAALSDLLLKRAAGGS